MCFLLKNELFCSKYLILLEYWWIIDEFEQNRTKKEEFSWDIGHLHKFSSSIVCFNEINSRQGFLWRKCFLDCACAPAACGWTRGPTVHLRMSTSLEAIWTRPRNPSNLVLKDGLTYRCLRNTWACPSPGLSSERPAPRGPCQEATRSSRTRPSEEGLHLPVGCSHVRTRSRARAPKFFLRRIC